MIRKNQSFAFLAVLLLVIAFMPAALFGTLADVKNKAVSVRETTLDVQFYGTTSFSATDSTNNLYTQSMYIGDCNAEHAFIRAYDVSCTAPITDSVDVYVEFSDDNTTWKAGTNASGKVLGLLRNAVMQADTLDRVTGVQDVSFFTWKYMRLKFDGLAGNNKANKVYWAVQLWKKVAGPVIPKAARYKDNTN
jgi:hypothetical protein